MPKRAKPKKDPVNQHIGLRVRLGRKIKGMILEDLGPRVGVSHGQAQRYETGANGLSAARLFAISQLLGLPIEFFFEGLPSDPDTTSIGPQLDLGGGALELQVAYSRIESQADRAALLRLAKSLATPAGSGADNEN